MDLNIFRWRALTTRVTLFMLAIFLASIWSLAFYTSRMLRADMQQLLGEQQFSSVSLVAAGIDQELDDRLKALATVAARVRPAMLGNPAELQLLLERHPIFQSLFNAGVFVTGHDGIATASLPLAANRAGVSYIDRDYIADTLTQGQPTVGRPVMGRRVQAPIIGMAAPIRDARGQVIGALAGVTDLSAPNFLDKITGNRYGKTGGYLLIAPQHRLIVAASDKRRVMEVLPAPGINPSIDRFIEGYEGSQVFVNPLGVELLASAKGVAATAWYVSANLPTAEAFAPIRDMQQRMLVVTLFLTLLAAGLIWWMLRRQLSPMLAAAKTLSMLATTDQPAQPLPVTRQDEIGELIGGFNRLLATLRQREDALRESEARFRCLTEMSSDFYWESDAEHRLTQRTESKREAAESVFRKTPSVGQRRWEIPSLAPDEAGWRMHRALLDAHLPFRDFEIARPRANGTVHHIAVSGDPVFDAAGHFKGYRGIGTDITERKQMEEQVRLLAFYDTLTQLPNRRLLNDRLSQALAASRRTGCYGALIFLDLDNFKPLNDRHGHAVGDLLLMEVADRLKNCVREMDTVARFGGDEFVVMLSELHADKAEATAQAWIVAEKIHLALAQPYRLTVKQEDKADAVIEHRCSASLGVAMFIHHEASEMDILKWADAAMYQAKEAGRNLVRFHDPVA